MKKIPLVVIAGPTGAGKNEIALRLAGPKGEIINADSRQIYRFLEIGTNQPSLETQKILPHHLFGIINPDVRYSAGEYQKAAKKVIEEIHSRKKIPFLVGGTGLYIRAVVDGIFEGPGADSKIRQTLLIKAKQEGSQKLYDELKSIDLEYALKIHPNDTVRIIRALEVYYVSGIPLSLYFKEQKKETNYNCLFLGIKMDRKILYLKIDRRVDMMADEGLVAEAKNAKDKGYSNIDAIGYRHIFDYFEGKLSLEKALELAKKDTRNYAKRQLTWFRADKRIDWYDHGEYDKISKRFNEWLKENGL